MGRLYEAHYLYNDSIGNNTDSKRNGNGCEAPVSQRITILYFLLGILYKVYDLYYNFILNYNIMEENKILVFALTYNKNYRKNSKMQQGDYADIIMDLRKYIKNYTFEIGDIQKRLHCHMLLHITQEDYLFCELYDKFKYKGFKHHLEECYNEQGWINYINKDKLIFGW